MRRGREDIVMRFAELGQVTRVVEVERHRAFVAGFMAKVEAVQLRVLIGHHLVDGQMPREFRDVQLKVLGHRMSRIWK